MDPYMDSNNPKARSIWSRMKTKISSRKSHSKPIPSNPGASNTQTLPNVPSSPQQLQSCSPAEASAGPQSSPIIELWDEAYDDLSKEKRGLMLEFEGILSKTLTGGIAAAAAQASSIAFSGLDKVRRRQQMQMLLDLKIKNVEEGAWKLLGFKDRQILVKDLVKPVISIVEFAENYVSKALEASPYGSIAWASVCLLLPLLLNPSEQGKAHVKALDEVASIISQCTMREILYHRRYESGDYPNSGPESKALHSQYKNALKMLYVKILGFHVSSICFLSKHSTSRVMEELFKWNDWSSMLVEIKDREAVLRATEDQWRDMKYNEECDLLKYRHEEYMKHLDLIEDDKRQLRMLFHAQQNSSERRDILSWLSSVDPSINYNSAREKHTLSTSQWFVNGNIDFKHWVDTPNSHLWLSGKVGAGKSVLCSAAIHHLCQLYDSEPYTALAYFYFSFGDSAKQSTENMLRSIIKQLCGRRPDVPPAFSKLRRFREINHQPDIESLENSFKESTQDFTRVYVIIDALDECPLEQRNTLLDVLLNIQKMGLANLHILYSSRQEPDIESKFESPISRHEITEIDLEKRRQEINEDIRIYIDNEIASPNFRSWPQSTKESAKTALVGKAHGMFQYVSLQLDALKLAKSLDAVEKALGDLPNGLDETCIRALLSIHPTKRSSAIRSLIWLSFSGRPLRLKELTEASVIDPKQSTFNPKLQLFKATDVLEFIPGGLIVIRGSFVHLAHFSVKEFLVSKRLKSFEGPASLFSTTSDDAHYHIAECWLLYHLHASQFNDDKPDLYHLQDAWPLSMSAATSWIGHVELLSRERPHAPLFEFIDRIIGTCTESLRTMVHIWIELSNGISLDPKVYVSPLVLAVYERYMQSLLLDWKYDPKGIGDERLLLESTSGDFTHGMERRSRLCDILPKTIGYEPHDHLIEMLAICPHGSRYSTYTVPLLPADCDLLFYCDSIELPYWNFDTYMWFLKQSCALVSALKTIHSFKSNSTSIAYHGCLGIDTILWFNDLQSRSPGGILCIADFALQRFHISPLQIAEYFSDLYSSPEICLRRQISPLADIWSLGCIFLDFITWLLAGSREVYMYHKFHAQASGVIMEVKDFFTLVESEKSQSQPYAEVSKKVADWISKLRRNPRCSEMCNEFLNVVEKEMLQIDPSARSSAESLVQTLEKMIARGENDMEYLLGNNPAIDTAVGIKLPPAQWETEPW